MHNDTLTNVFWGVFLVWFGLVAATLGGNLLITVNEPLFALGTGVLLILLNLIRAFARLKVSPLTVGLGVLVTVIYAPLYFLNVNVPFLPALLVIVGLALIIGTVRTRQYITVS